MKNASNGETEIDNEQTRNQQTAFAFGHVQSFITTYAASIGVTWQSIAGGVGALLLNAAGGPGLGLEYQMPRAGVRDHAPLRGNVRVSTLALDDGAHNSGARKAAPLIKCPACPRHIPGNGLHKHLMGSAHGWTAAHYRRWAKAFRAEPKHRGTARATPARRHMSAATKRRMSERMKAAWAERKKAKAQAA